MRRTLRIYKINNPNNHEGPDLVEPAFHFCVVTSQLKLYSLVLMPLYAHEPEGLCYAPRGSEAPLQII